MTIKKLLPAKVRSFISRSDVVQCYLKGKSFFEDAHYRDAVRKTLAEDAKQPSRTEIINFLLSTRKGATTYLEIGVRNPQANFDHVVADRKYSVDPGIEFSENPVDFPFTSDVFFQKLSHSEILSADQKFDVIFIDGLHLAEQVDRDIANALKYIHEDGFIVLHDCNPPTEWHSRELYTYHHTPAGGNWNGTTWKAFLKWRSDQSVHSCCIDSDWGVGILSKTQPIGGHTQHRNPFYEFGSLEANRKEYLNLVDFSYLKKALQR